MTTKNLRILGKVDDEVFDKLSSKLSTYNDLVFLFTGHSDNEFQLGDIFKELKIGNKTIYVNASLQFITQAYFVPVEFIEKGSRSIIGLNFIGETPIEISSLPSIGSWDSKNSTSDAIISI